MGEQLLIVACVLFFPPLLLLVAVVLLLATCGKSLGIRRRYVRLLRALFQWGRSEMRLQQRHMGDGTPAAEDEEEEEDGHDSSDCDSGGETLLPDGERRGSTDRASEGAVSTEGPQSYTPKLRRRRRRRRTAKLIERAASERMAGKLDEAATAARPVGRVWTVTDDSLDFIQSGIESIVEDEVTRRFLAEELVSWNMLTRTTDGLKYRHVTWRLGFAWLAGVTLRYCVLLPARLLVLALALLFILVSTAIIGYIPSARLRDWAYCAASTVACRIFSRSITAIIDFHDRENMPERGGICVANHTSPIDALILGGDRAYSFIGQRHGGLLGMVQRALGRASAHIWFERDEAGDRRTVLKRIRAHVSAARSLPILIFPEGTCINNTSVMMFKKGSFEVDATIYPVAIKYDPTFGDAFWNSSQQAWIEYMLMMMTSWAIVADVWYLPPMSREPSESAVDFANRVKRVIALAGGLVDLEWDGALKRTAVPHKLRARQQQLYSVRLSRVRSSTGSGAQATDQQQVSESSERKASGGNTANLTQSIMEEVFDDDEDAIGVSNASNEAKAE